MQSSFDIDAVLLEMKILVNAAGLAPDRRKIKISFWYRTWP